MLPSRRIILLVLMSVGRLSAQGCDSRRTQLGDSAIDLAPPRGFTEVCSLDSQLCNILTAGYPASARTLGYFVATADWDGFRRDSSLGFKHYLIAQLAVSMTPDELPGFKTYLRSQQGSIPDHTDLPRILTAQGRVPVGIVGETPISISFGTIMFVRPQSSPSADAIALVATNTVAIVRNHVLSLYVFQNYHGDADVDTAKVVTATWLRCIGKAN